MTLTVKGNNLLFGFGHLQELINLAIRNYNHFTRINMLNIHCHNRTDNAIVLEDTSITSIFSLLSIMPDDDISVGFRPFPALLVGERIVQFEI